MTSIDRMIIKIDEISTRLEKIEKRIEDCYDFNSDHSAVILNLSENIVNKATKPVLTNFPTDWMSFKLELDSKLDLSVSLNTAEEFEHASENFTKLIQNKTAWANTKITDFRKISTRYPEYIMKKVKDKRKARKSRQQSRDPADKNILNKTQQLSREIKRFP